MAEFKEFILNVFTAGAGFSPAPAGIFRFADHNV